LPRSVKAGRRWISPAFVMSHLNTMKSLFSLASLAFVVATLGCATTSSHTSASASGQSATCEVCRYRNDLACVCVKVNPDTPRTEYQGSTYYFCSDECREAFLKKPAKYAHRH